MSVKEAESYGKVSYARVKAALTQIEDHYRENPERLEDIEITFEYLVGSFFPEIINNINEKISKTFNEGYSQGLKDARGLYCNDSEGNN